MIYVANALVLIGLFLMFWKIYLFPITFLILGCIQIYHNEKIFSKKSK